MLLVERLNNGQIDLLALASISQPEFPLERALGLDVGSNMFFIYIYIFNSLWPRQSGGAQERQVDGGETPITCQHCQGQWPIIPRLLAAIHGNLLLSLQCFLLDSHQRVQPGVERINVYKYVKKWSSMDSFDCVELFVRL